ncbi:MAG: fluoride efflux transporter CrcB [Gemmatimonadetes bacterium]|nr:fluoride efflux transporter CrcB [Gemmatimonadota bacterium]
MIWVGGMAGAWARYRLSLWIHGRAGAAFPWATLVVNLSGSFLLGMLMPFLATAHVPAALQAFIAVGVVGAFTTFSTFALDTVLLLRDGRRLRASLYVAASLVLGLLSLAAGFAAASALQ